MISAITRSAAYLPVASPCPGRKMTGHSWRTPAAHSHPQFVVIHFRTTLLKPEPWHFIQWPARASPPLQMLLRGVNTDCFWQACAASSRHWTSAELGPISVYALLDHHQRLPSPAGPDPAPEKPFDDAAMGKKEYPAPRAADRWAPRENSAAEYNDPGNPSFSPSSPASHPALNDDSAPCCPGFPVATRFLRRAE